ncbi:hypothetical protein A9Q87_05120 [Flavobacteriales bacterium 34_180_T64]|nr:hypothetical protein A9Q87_05120 [Flavobacteriales bacterium 34_180_T64]
MTNKRLHTIKKTGFKAPDNYFESFDERLLDTFNANQQLSNIETSGHKIPEQYLESFDKKLLSKISPINEPKVVQFISWNKLAYTIAVAASLILIFSLVFKASYDLSFETIETASLEIFLDEGEFTSYELASLLTDDELNSNSFTETSISESSIEDYLLENASIEDLIIE